jgi:hypothetical protein
VNELTAGMGCIRPRSASGKRQLGTEAKEIFGSRRLKEAQVLCVVLGSRTLSIPCSGWKR